MFFSRSMQSSDTTDFFVIENRTSKVNEEMQGNQSQGDVNKKKPLIERQKFEKFYNAPITKFWSNVVRSLHSSIHSCCICCSSFLLTCCSFFSLSNSNYFTPAKKCWRESCIIDFTSAKMEFASAIFKKLYLSKYSIKRWCKQITFIQNFVSPYK